MDWLEPQFEPRGSDPDTMQNEKFNLQEEGTCEWMVQSTIWEDWIQGGIPHPDGGRRFLWVHGLPGTGKTILTSFLIDHVKEKFRSKGCSHYYCFHGHERDETVPFLRWVVRDLCKQLGRFIPAELHHMWEKKRLTVKSLLECLRVISGEFNTRAYILVDAIDESHKPRDAFLKVLTTIGTDPGFENISLLITSRNYQDIKETIQNLPRIPTGSFEEFPPLQMLASALPGLPSRGPRLSACSTPIPTTPRTPTSGRRRRRESSSPGPRTPSPIKRKLTPGGSHVDVVRQDSMAPEDGLLPCTILDMDNHYVKKAIREFIRKQVDRSPRFRNAPARFLEQMQIDLADKAGGMFRIVACHLDMIERLDLPVVDEKAILDVIHAMPETYFSTYEKILVEGIPKNGDANMHNREFARTALALICSSTSMIPDAGVLVEASRFNVPQYIAQDYNLEKLKKVLGCMTLVTSMRKKPPSEFSRDASETGVSFKRFSIAHYTVKEYLFHETTAKGPAQDFALSSEKARKLELKIVFYGLRRYQTETRKCPTRYEEYCLKMTDRALSKRPSIVVKDREIWEAVFPCLAWDATHQNAVTRNNGTRRAFPTWAKLAAFEKDGEPKHGPTGILVSLLLLEWPELAEVYLKTLDNIEKSKIWKTKFALSGGDARTVLQMCVSNRRPDFLEAMANAGATFKDEHDILYRALQDPYGTGEGCDNGTTTSKLLQTLLKRGAIANPRGYKYTPLQVAVHYLEKVWVQLLLGEPDEGADPDRVGDPNGIDPPQCDDLDRSWFEMTPLQMCSDVSAHSDGENRKDRERVRTLLSMHRKDTGDRMGTSGGSARIYSGVPRDHLGSKIVIDIDD